MADLLPESPSHSSAPHQPAPLSFDALEALSPIEAFLHTLDLTDTGARTRDDIFTGPSQWMPHGRVFGGQVAAQSLVAAARTVASDRPVHSMHGYFLRPGDVKLPITFAVDRIHDGNSFTTRAVSAFQSGQPIWSMIASFQDVNDGFEHEVTMPEGIPDPEDLPSEADLLETVKATLGSEAPESLAAYWLLKRPFTMRHVNGPVYLEPASDLTPAQAVWIKAVERMPDDLMLHRAAIAYASDYSILEPIMRGHGLTWSTPGLRAASLDHGVWWHRDARADEWLLYVQDSPVARGGRGLSRGQLFSRDGALVATVAQEGMVRRKRS